MSGVGSTPLSPLVSMLGLPTAANIDVLSDQNSDGYWERSERFDMALDLSVGRRGLCALAEVVTCWISHLLALDVTVAALPEMHEAAFSWYVGLDAEGTRVGDALWNGEELDDLSRSQTVGLYRLAFRDDDAVLEKLRGEPVYLIAAMSRDKVLRLKPQNLITGLPLKSWEAIS